MTGPRGFGATPGRVRVLTLVVLLAALSAAVVGLFQPAAVPADDQLSPLARLGIATGVLAVAQLARLRFRVAAGTVSVSWGEAALIIGLYLAPAAWLPAATFAGALAAWVLLSVFSDRRTSLEIVHIAGSLTAAVAVAVSVTTMVGDPFEARLTPILAGALALGSLTYLLVTGWLAALTLSLRQGRPLGPLFLRALRGKLLMFVGNVFVGLVVVTMIDRDLRWLLLLPPVLWLLQQTYGHRLRADEERRLWERFAGATKELNRLDERAVAAAGVSGALALFGAERVEVDVQRPDGIRRRYHRDSVGPLAETDLSEPPARAESDGGEQAGVRSLAVAGVLVGELRVRFPRSVEPGTRDQMALSAFADALASALHDAATHRQLQILTDRSTYEAVHDPLTKLVNRTALLFKGDAALRRVERETPVALLLLDIDHFKEVNDTLGHAAGDELLQATAARLGALTEDGELLARLDGDEFALLVTELGDGGDRSSPMPVALRRAREIIERLATPTEVAGVLMSVEASIGVVVAPAGSADMAELVRRAENAMYQAKEGGGNLAWYDSAKDEASTDRLALIAELHEALDTDDQLVLALQPAVDLSTGAPTGVEALIRWRHPRRGTLTPGDFVRAVEGSDLLARFTRYVVDQALFVASEWANQGLDVPISVNLSARSLLDPHLPADIAELLRRHRVPARRLVLEITETVVLSELEVIDEVLAALRDLGVQLSVDDFGTGFSSFTFLTRVTVDEVKIDRSFVRTMADSHAAAAIVHTTVALGHQLGLRVVAEGVETADQRAALAALGCSAAQGYHFFKPMPADKIAAVLRSLLDSAQAQIYPLRADGAS
ncbi:bifunctional diguanylate cyclase/phosphodiesterase [Phytohabitans rumicis]|uniref:putative bifunctional diguanylate cyclase/phosphodiesterase n=1 Tax=Phytohabitans rumicis TaxID=1076125 RepID=UPI0031E5A258